MANDAQAERITHDDIIRMVNELADDDRGEFMEGLVKHMWLVEQSESREAVHDLAVYVRSWVNSMRLQQNEAWRRQVQEYEERVASGDGEPESIDDFEERLAASHRLVS